MTELMKKFDDAIRLAITKYGDEHIDIIITDDGAYGAYHSSNNSFDVTGTFDVEELGGVEKLKKYESEFDELCICEQ